jgi:DNA polymerase III subunit gamma/tau
MSYLVLARKWRPKTFDEVVGQTTVMRTLKNALTSGRIGHAFLLSGARGVGKTTTARILAKALNCSRAEGPTADPCGECSSCLEVAEGKSMDVQEIDGATNNSVDQVRELRESARYNPARDRFKVWIIDEVHMLSTGAFNALLKTLEEPPPRVKFIFATTEYHKLPDTILSRCQQYDFRLIPARELQAHLRGIADKEGLKVSDEALARIARAAEGSARDALSLFDQVLSFSGNEVKDEDISALLGLIDRDLLLGASQGVLAGDSLALLDLIERLSDYGADYRNFAREVLLHFREILLVKLAPATSALLAPLVPEERERLRPLAEAFSEDDLLRSFDVLTKLDTELRFAQDPRVMLELALLKLAQMRRLVPFADLVARVERMSAGLPPEPARPAVSAPRPTFAATPPTAPSVASAPPPRPQAPVAPVASTSPLAPPREDAGTPVAPSGFASIGGDEPLARMLEALQRRPTLAQPLRTAQARLESDVLELAISSDYFALATTHIDEYQDLAKKTFSRGVKVRIVAAAAAPAPPAEAPTPQSAARERLMTAAGKDPVVQDALDLFGGKVVAVRESEA